MHGCFCRHLFFQDDVHRSLEPDHIFSNHYQMTSFVSAIFRLLSKFDRQIVKNKILPPYWKWQNEYSCLVIKTMRISQNGGDQDFTDKKIYDKNYRSGAVVDLQRSIYKEFVNPLF